MVNIKGKLANKMHCILQEPEHNFWFQDDLVLRYNGTTLQEWRDILVSTQSDAKQNPKKYFATIYTPHLLTFDLVLVPTWRTKKMVRNLFLKEL